MSKPEESREELYYDNGFYHVKLEGTEEQVARAKELLDSHKLIESVIQETGVSVVTQNGVMTRESIQREAERLYERARHDEASALYNARQKGFQEGIKLGIAKRMLIDGEPVSKIMRYTGLSQEEIEELR